MRNSIVALHRLKLTQHTSALSVLCLILVLSYRDVANAEEISARIALGALNIQLTDLDPNDGVTPDFQWTQDAWTEEIERDASLRVADLNNPGLMFSDPQRVHIAGDYQADLEGNPSFVETKGDIQGLEVFLTMAPSAEAKTAFGFVGINLEPSRRFFAATDTSPANYFGSNYTFEVTPNTAILFSASVSSVVSNFADDLDAHLAWTDAEMVVGNLESEEPEDFENPPFYPRVLDLSSPNWNGSSRFSISTFASTGSMFEHVQENSADSTLYAEYVNAHSEVANGYFYLEAGAQISTAAVIIPETSTVILAVVAGSGLVVQRRSLSRFANATALD